MQNQKVPVLQMSENEFITNLELQLQQPLSEINHLKGQGFIFVGTKQKISTIIKKRRNAKKEMLYSEAGKRQYFLIRLLHSLAWIACH